MERWRKGKESRTSRARNIHPSRVYNAGTDEAPCAQGEFLPLFLSLSSFFSSSFSSSSFSSFSARAICLRVPPPSSTCHEGRKEEGKSRGKKKKESGRLRGLYVVMYKEGCFAVYPREVTWKKNANVAKKVALSFASTRKREGKTRSIEKSELETVVDSNRGNSDIFDHRYYRWMDFDPRFGKFDLNRRVIFSG